jgi:hypothetical protein
MKAMKIARGTTRAQRRATGGPLSAAAQAAREADRKRWSRNLAVKLYHKAGAGI